LKVHEFSAKKFYACREAAQQNALLAPIHGNIGKDKITSKFDIANAWFSIYVENYGNLEPSGEIHLCIYNRWQDIYDTFLKEQKDQGYKEDDVYTYSSFRKMVKTHFTHVKKPKKTVLPQCDVCSTLTQKRISCRSTVEREQLIEAMKKHSNEHQAERNSYQARIQKAIAAPEAYLSLIIDGATHRQFPHRCKVPKMFMNAARLEIGTVGIYDHGNKIRKLLQVLPLYSNDSNLVLTVLHQHLQELAAKGPLPPVLYLQFFAQCAFLCATVLFIFTFVYFKVKFKHQVN